MVTVTRNEDKVVFEVMGSHKFWSFEDKIIVAQANIIQATQSKDEFTFWKGWKCPGTEVPWLITAGTYYKKGRIFWDVMNKDKTIVVELKDEYYKKLIIEVENPTATLHLLNNK